MRTKIFWETEIADRQLINKLTFKDIQETV